MYVHKMIFQKLQDTLELTHSHDHKSNISSMEGIRGIATFLVFIEHYVAVLEDRVGISQQYAVYDLYLWLRNIGSVGVDLFFVLSGYLIYGTIISKNRPFLPYIRRRINRIYPTFTVMFVIYLALSVAMPENSKVPTEIGAGITYLLQSFLLMAPLFADINQLIAVAWSLNYEIFFYLFIPVFVTLSQIRNWSGNQRIMLFVVATIIGYLYCYNYQGHIRLLMFIAGMILFEVINNCKQEKATPYLGGILFTLSLIACVQLMLYKIPNGSWWRQVIIYIGFFMLCYECFSWNSPTAKLFSITPLRWLGNMSYSYYLIHGLVVQAAIIVVAKFYVATPIISLSYFVMLGGGVFFCTLIPAFILFICIEKPFSLAKK